MRDSRIFVVLSIIILIQSFISGFFWPILLKILITLHLDQNTVSNLTRLEGNVMFSIYFVCLLCPAYLILSPIIGAYSDEHGRKKSLYKIMLAPILGYSLIWYSIQLNSLWLILGSLLLFSMSKLYLPLIMAMITDISAGKKRAWFFGILHLMMFTIFLSTQFANTLLQNLNEPLNIFIRRALVLLIIFEVINFSIAAFILPETRKNIQDPKQLTAQLMISRILKIFTEKKVFGFFGWLFCLSFFWSLYSQLSYNIFTKKFHFNYHQLSLFMIYNFFIVAAGIIFVYPHVIKKMTLRFIVSVFGFLIIGFIGCGIFPSLTGQLLFIIPLAGGIIVLLPLLLTLISNRLDSSQQGLMMGIMAPSTTIAYVLSGFISIKLIHYSTSSILALATGGIFMFFLLVVSGKKLFSGENFNE